MKKFLILVFILFYSGSFAQSYRPMYNFGKDTIAYMQYNFGDRKAQYINQPLSKILKDYELRVIFSTCEDYHYYTSEPPTINGAFLDYTYDNNRPYAMLDIRFKTPHLTYKTVENNISDLDNDMEWADELKNCIVSDIIVSVGPFGGPVTPLPTPPALLFPARNCSATSNVHRRFWNFSLPVLNKTSGYFNTFANAARTSKAKLYISLQANREFAAPYGSSIVYNDKTQTVIRSAGNDPFFTADDISWFGNISMSGWNFAGLAVYTGNEYWVISVENYNKAANFGRNYRANAGTYEAYIRANRASFDAYDLYFEMRKAFELSAVLSKFNSGMVLLRVDSSGEAYVIQANEVPGKSGIQLSQCY